MKTRSRCAHLVSQALHLYRFAVLTEGRWVHVELRKEREPELNSLVKSKDGRE
jgi:hypothetical protein